MAATTSPFSNFDREFIHKLSILKIWVDNNGMGPSWEPAISPKPFDTDIWFSGRKDWDDQKIGLLTGKAPPIEALEKQLFKYYSWLKDLSPGEQKFAKANEGDRSDVLKAISDLENSRLNQKELW